jgi:hypothetical protein
MQDFRTPANNQRMKNKNKLLFSIFENLNGIKGAFQTTPTQTLNFNELVNYYNSQENKELSQAILSATTPEEKNKLKSERAYYTPYGTFSTRRDANILKHNNVVSIDIDDLKSKEEAEEIRNKLAEHKSTLFALLSTRGKGVKAMMLVEASYTPEENHTQLKHIFKPYLKDFLKIADGKIDEAQFVLSQPCYFSFDADMYVNAAAEPLQLDFNYKEPKRRPFKAVKVPKNAVSKVDAYILKILENKLQLLTPDGARHPKLANIKGLAELVHYAPHLENQIIESFIQAGENMYSANEKNKIRQVRKNVLDAWNEGIKFHTNHKSIDNILSQHTPIVKANNNTHSHKLTTQYIGQDSKAMNLIENFVRNNKFTSLGAGMGMGKTTMTLQLQKMLNRKIIVSVPTIAIAEQQYKITFSDGSTEDIDKALVVGGVVGFDVEMVEECDVIYVTNASLGKLQNIGDKILIVDEAHLTSDRSPINQRANLNLWKVMKHSYRTLFMSGTPNDILEYGISKEFKRIKLEALNEEKFFVTPLVYNNESTKLKDVVRNFAMKKEGIRFIFMNNKSVLNDLKDDLIKLGVYKADEVVMYSANEEDVEHQNYITLMKDGRIPDGKKVVLATSKVAEGVNINNEAEFSFLYVGNEVNDFLQSFRRPRKAISLKVYTLFEASFYSKSGKVIDEVKLYKDLVKEVTAETVNTTDFMSGKYKKKERFSISEDFYSRSHFVIDGNNVLNPFEIAHEVKTVKESHYNFEIWKADVLAKMPNIEFKEPIAVKVAGDEEADKNDKARREIKKEFIEKLKGIYQTNEVLNLVHRQSKNDNLKGAIKKHLKGADIENTLTTAELILFRDKCFKQVSKWIENTFKLSKVVDAGFSTTAKIMQDQELFSAAKFNRIYEGSICLLLEQENTQYKSRSEQRLFNKYKKVLDVLKDVEEISKEDLEEIFRTKFYYRKSTFDRSVVLNEIGFVYDVEYDKKRKVYTLKKEYHKSVCSIENLQKIGTTKQPNNQQLNPSKTPYPPSGDQTAHFQQKMKI